MSSAWVEVTWCVSTHGTAGKPPGLRCVSRGELRKGEQVVEESIAMLSSGPDGGEQEGGLFFERDPEGYQLRLRATGYEKP